MDRSGNLGIRKDQLVAFADFRITSAETDAEARIRPGALANLLIQSATESADSLGFGFEGLKEHNLFWVLSRISVKVFKRLKWYDRVEIETWPRDISGILYLRDFIARDGQGDTAALGTSAWLAIDLKKRRPKRFEGELHDLFVSMKDRIAYEDLPEKLPGISVGDNFRVTSKYFDIDLNRHVTSTRYIDWMMDTFPIDFHREYYPKSLSVNFIKETLPDSVLDIVREERRDREYFFEGVHSGTGETAFRGKVIF